MNTYYIIYHPHVYGNFHLLTSRGVRNHGPLSDSRAMPETTYESYVGGRGHVGTIQGRKLKTTKLEAETFFPFSSIKRISSDSHN